MATPLIATTPQPTGSLPPMPIQADWIVEGRPEARGTIVLQSADKCVSSGFWECTAGVFDWVFAWDEFIHVLEGEVKIREEGGAVHSLKAGDSAHFPLGLKTRWTVSKYVRKFFVLRTPGPLNL